MQSKRKTTGKTKSIIPSSSNFENCNLSLLAVAKDKVDEKFSKLSSVMSEMENEVPILVTDEDHFTDILTPMQKYRLYKDVMSLEVSVMVIRYDPGGGCPLIVFMERVDSTFSEDARYNIAIKILATIEPDIPKYHTRSMRRQFKKTIDILSAELERQIEQFVAVDERRHGVAHMSDYLSIRDLREQVAKNLPDGTPIPSESTVIHSFAPPNMYAKSSQYYTERINLRFTI